MDAPRDFLIFYFFIFLFFYFFIFSPNEQREGGRGGALPDFFFFPCSADHERDWPPCKVVFFGLATNALNVRNYNNNSSVGGGGGVCCQTFFVLFFCSFFLFSRPRAGLANV